jgi:CBS domain-containing protein
LDLFQEGLRAKLDYTIKFDCREIGESRVALWWYAWQQSHREQEGSMGEAGGIVLEVSAYMTRNVTTLRNDCHLLDAALMIRRTGKRHVPIVDENGKLVGIISDRDVSRLSPSMLANMTPEDYNRVFEATPIAAAMTKNPITIAPDSSVRDAVNILYTKRVSALPVVDGDQLVGIVTISDMLGLLNQLLADGEAASGATP